MPTPVNMPRPAPPGSERRTAVRHSSRQKSPARLTRATGEGPWMVRVRNVSADGVGLIANHAFKKGMLLTIELPTRNPNKLGTPKQIKITHAAPQGTGWWVLGGVFSSRLSQEEMDALM
ncbi:hypothetical protein AYO44_07760 [Planctomycetaceae bacterium SCGC AG-212-F19]|nr:hypothetical protein AYO44_07760 [Planctomycetaceae bacterium SCGC AG-212-F19]